MKRQAIPALALICFGSILFSQQKSVTIEGLLSAPFPTELTAAPAKGRVAWFFNIQGRRNVWVAEPTADGNYKARQITSYNEDDGQEVGELSWSPDAETIVFTRGGDANPRSLPQGAEQGVYTIKLRGGGVKPLGEGHSASVSPKGDRVAFISKAQVWLASLDGSRRSQQLIRANGEASNLRWSPDGSKLAFESRRGDHGFIGVYDFTAKSLVYLDASVDRDQQAVWSPDGRQIAYIRIPSEKGRIPFFTPQGEGEPWSIRIADPVTGKGHEIWRAKVGRGSVFHEVVADNQLFWSTGDQIVFPWERDGWTHLYCISTHGGTAKLLTPGDFEVESVSLSASHQEVIFSSNQDDIDRRHIWRVSPGADHPTAVTSGAGIETAPVLAGDNRTVFLLHSDARIPMRPALVGGKGDIRDLAPDALPSDFPASALAVPQQVVISAADGMRVHGQLFLPTSPGNGTRHPAILFLHGGSRRQMLLGWHSMYYYCNTYAMNQYLASRGYIVLSLNYRSGIGYGLDFREALNFGPMGASEFNDIKGAGLYLRSRPEVDPQRIGLWGGSYGGYLTALGLARASDIFAAGVDFNGVHNWKQIFALDYKPNDRPDVARIAWESSPLPSISTWRSPVLLIHGDDDRDVPFSETVDLVEALRKQGVEFEQLVFPDEAHVFLLHRAFLSAYHATSDFFDRRLKERTVSASATAH